MLDLPRLMRAVDAADEAGVDLEQIRAAQQTLATAQRRAAAKEGLVAALAPSVEELTSSDAALFRLREAAAEAEAVGLPSLAAAQQKLAAAEKVLAQKEELGRREAGRREEQDRARREAETELKAAMPGMLTSAEPHRLQAAALTLTLAQTLTPPPTLTPTPTPAPTPTPTPTPNPNQVESIRTKKWIEDDAGGRVASYQVRWKG